MAETLVVDNPFHCEVGENHPLYEEMRGEPPTLSLRREEGGAWRPRSALGALYLLGGAEAPHAEEAARAAAGVLNEGALTPRELKREARGLRGDMRRRLRAEGPYADDVIREAAEMKTPGYARAALAVRLGMEMERGTRDSLLSAEAAEMGRAGAGAALSGRDFPPPVLYYMARCSKKGAALAALLDRDPAHPGGAELVAEWCADRAAQEGAARLGAGANAALWDTGGELLRREALSRDDFPPRARYAAWLGGGDHLPFHLPLFMDLIPGNPEEARRMLRCAADPADLEAAGGSFNADLRVLAGAHLAALRGKGERVGTVIWTEVPWRKGNSVALWGGIHGRGTAESSVAAGNEWRGGASWLRFGAGMVWTPGGRCACSGSRCEYLSPLPPAQLRRILAEPFAGAVAPPTGAKGMFRRGKAGKFELRVAAEEDLTEGMRMEVEVHTSRGSDMEPTLIGKKLREGVWEGFLTRREG